MVLKRVWWALKEKRGWVWWRKQSRSFAVQSFLSSSETWTIRLFAPTRSNSKGTRHKEDDCSARLFFFFFFFPSSHAHRHTPWTKEKGWDKGKRKWMKEFPSWSTDQIHRQIQEGRGYGDGQQPWNRVGGKERGKKKEAKEKPPLDHWRKDINSSFGNLEWGSLDERYCFWL